MVTSKKARQSNHRCFAPMVIAAELPGQKRPLEQSFAPSGGLCAQCGDTHNVSSFSFWALHLVVHDVSKMINFDQLQVNSEILRIRSNCSNRESMPGRFKLSNYPFVLFRVAQIPIFGSFAAAWPCLAASPWPRQSEWRKVWCGEVAGAA